MLANCDGGKVSLSFILNVLDLIWSKPWVYFMTAFALAMITEHVEDSELLCVMCSDSVCGFDYGNIQNTRFPLRIAMQ